MKSNWWDDYAAQPIYCLLPGDLDYSICYTRHPGRIYFQRLLFSHTCPPSSAFPFRKSLPSPAPPALSSSIRTLPVPDTIDPYDPWSSFPAVLLASLYPSAALPSQSPSYAVSVLKCPASSMACFFTSATVRLNAYRISFCVAVTAYLNRYIPSAYFTISILLNSLIASRHSHVVCLLSGCLHPVFQACIYHVPYDQSDKLKNHRKYRSS